MKQTTVLAIETSCDETAAAVAFGDARGPTSWEISSSVIASQVEIHREWGGVVPELASRPHLRDICGVVQRALHDGGVGWTRLDAIAVTQGPGLVGSLLVGVAFAKSLALALARPLVPVHHLAGHIESLFLCEPDLPLPAVVLVVSGGHTSLYHLPEAGVYRLVGRTRDDAAGEAFDKVAKLLGLTYPGGPVVDRLARDGDESAIQFPVARMTHAERAAGPQTGSLPGFPRRAAGELDFSFSGLKTAVARHVQRRRESNQAPLPDGEIADVCASFRRGGGQQSAASGRGRPRGGERRAACSSDLASCNGQRGHDCGRWLAAVLRRCYRSVGSQRQGHVAIVIPLWRLANTRHVRSSHWAE